MQDRDVERVCCLLDETQLSEYDDPLDTYAAAFGEDRVTHAPIEDFSVVDRRTLHETIVELVVELMEHAVSHAEDDAAVREFEASMLDFDVSEFVERYRAERDLSADDVRA